jgi:hypothetical protein
MKANQVVLITQHCYTRLTSFSLSHCQALQTELLLQNATNRSSGDSYAGQESIVTISADNLWLSVQGSVTIGREPPHSRLPGPSDAGGKLARRRSFIEKAGIASLGVALSSAFAVDSAGELGQLMERMVSADGRRSRFSPTPLSLMEVLRCVERWRRRENQENVAASGCSHVIGRLVSHTLVAR